jgi:hypothetical protein
MSGPDSRAHAALAAVIEHNLRAIARVEAALVELPPFAGYGACAGVAYGLHNLYSALENCFDQISRTFENHVVDREQWHRELMLKMFLAIPGIRPAVLPAQVRPLLNELRSFRHLFRHSYEFQLDPVRLNSLTGSWRAGGPAVLTAMRTFADWLTTARSTQ